MIDVSDLPPVLFTDQAAELLATTPATLWRLAREGRAPVPVLRLGSRSLRWPTKPILELLGLDDQNGNSSERGTAAASPAAAGALDPSEIQLRESRGS